jgi:hypothetical protein
MMEIVVWMRRDMMKGKTGLISWIKMIAHSPQDHLPDMALM